MAPDPRRAGPRGTAGGQTQTWRFSATPDVRPEGIVLTLTGRLGHGAVPVLEDALRRLPPSLGQGTVVLDLAGVDYLSSLGLRTIDAFSCRLQNGGRRLSVRNLTDPVRVVMELSGLIERVDVVEPASPSGD